MADAIATFDALRNDAASYLITKEMYELAERRMTTGQFAHGYTLDSYMGKTMRIVRYSRFALPTQTLVEPVPPDATPVTFVYVDVTVEQWGIVAQLGDVALVTITHPILQIAIDRCALALSELCERENAKVLMTGTSVIYGANKAGRDSLVMTGTPRDDRLTTSVILNGLTQLKAQGAPRYDGELYAGIVQPQQS